VAISDITKSSYESLCSLRGRVDCFVAFSNLMPEEHPYASVIASFSKIISDSLEELEGNFSGMHCTLKSKDFAEGNENE
jgi:hypothetical protein